MKVPGLVFDFTHQLTAAGIDYRIVGGQAAVYYGLHDETRDWDFALVEMVPEVGGILKQLEFEEVPDSEGLSWMHGDDLSFDFIVADGEVYPTLEELGMHSTHNLKFVDRSMMGYINWKEGDSPYQHLHDYKEQVLDTELPPEVQKVTDMSRFNQFALMNSPSLRGIPMKSLASLVKLAQKLEQHQFPIEAMLVDRVLHAFDGGMPMPQPGPSAAGEWRNNRIIEEALTKVSGIPPADIRYYKSIKPVIEQFKGLLEQAEQSEKGSQQYRDVLRNLTESFNSKYDPHNTDHVPTKIRFLAELMRICDLVEKNAAKFDKPELSDSTIIDNMVSALKEHGYLKEFNALKKKLD